LLTAEYTDVVIMMNPCHKIYQVPHEIMSRPLMEVLELLFMNGSGRKVNINALVSFCFGFV